MFWTFNSLDQVFSDLAADPFEVDRWADDGGRQLKECGSLPIKVGATLRIKMPPPEYGEISGKMPWLHSAT